MTKCDNLNQENMFKIITLTNGKKVANFSSPHPFLYEDGSILPEVAPNIAEKYKVTFHENINEANGDIELSFSLSDEVWLRMLYFLKLHKHGEIDVVICPLPMITALHDNCYDVKSSPFRTIRVTDRINKLISINHQCL